MTRYRPEDAPQAHVHVTYFEESSLVEQISLMQRVDVLVGVTGSGLTNLAFLRPGSLVIELPTMHEGGALVLSHEGETMRFGHTGVPAALTSHWAAFYDASARELQPVTKGSRLSLLYTLSRSDEGPPLLPPSQAGASRRFARLARHWVDDEEGDAPQKLFYFLDESFSSDSDWDALEGDDAAIVEALLGARHGQEPAFDLFLATFAR